MYDELVKDLRESAPKALAEADFDFVEGWLKEAADALEELQKCVPKTPHGRLIDADAFLKEIDKQENAMFEHGHEFTFSFKSGGDICTAWYNVEMMVEDAPTIIEAEEGET